MTLSYNHAPYLGAAIESVLAQTIQDFELIVVDDGSADGSLDIARRYAEADRRVHVLTHPGHENRGIGATANLGRSATRGRFLFGLPSDDVLLSDTLEREIAFLEAHPDVGFVYGYTDLLDEQGRVIEVQGRTGPVPVRWGMDLTGEGRIVERLIQRNSIPAMTVMWRRECIEQTGDEHPAIVYSDWELHTRAAARWEVGFIPRVLALYRRHDTNTSRPAPRETILERQFEVTASLRERATSTGGRLAEPRIRALLELQVAYLRFAGGTHTPEANIERAFQRDPALARDARWLSDWLWSRLLEELLPKEGPDFAEWFVGAVRARLEPQAARRMRREAAAVRAETRAIRRARAGRLVSAYGWALVAWACSPRRLSDPGLASVLLHATVRTPWGGAARMLKRRILTLLTPRR